MNTEIAEIKQLIAGELGMPMEEIPDSILYKIYNDELFLHHLSTCKEDKDFLILLLKGHHDPAEPVALPGNRELIVKLSRSLKNWIGSGLRKTSKEEYARRLSACSMCPNKTRPDGRALYVLLNPAFVCRLCGCDIERKAMIQTETCPDTKFAAHGRW